MTEQDQGGDPRSSDIITEIRHRTGIITLDRPRALNSISQAMSVALDSTIRQWAGDDAIDQVVLRSSGKHFCAGGDVRWLRDMALSGQEDIADAYLDREYAVDALIAEYPKPFISLLNGFVMGGGVGLSAHGTHRVVTAETILSMPESNIGFVNDVGSTYLFQRLPGHASLPLGLFLGLTGYRLTGADLVELGIATHLVESFDGVLDAIVSDGPTALDRLSVGAGESELPDLYPTIDSVFVGSWPDIRQRLARTEPDFQKFVNGMLAQASPASLVASTETFIQSSTGTLREAFDNELAIAKTLLRSSDFHEGVRAVLIDKTRDATFSPEPDPKVFRSVLRDRPSVISSDQHR